MRRPGGKQQQHIAIGRYVGKGTPAVGRRLVALVRARAGSPPAALSTAILTAPDQKDAIVAL